MGKSFPTWLHIAHKISLLQDYQTGILGISSLGRSYSASIFGAYILDDTVFVVNGKKKVNVVNRHLPRKSSACNPDGVQGRDIKRDNR